MLKYIYMKKYEEKKFSIGELAGISEKTNATHLKLYAGYVKNTNIIFEKLSELSADEEKNSYAIAETRRRIGFEFDGMRNHEYFFPQFEGGAKDVDKESDLFRAITEQFGSFEKWKQMFTNTALTRGIGWAILYKDTDGTLINAWIGEHELGHLTGLSPILLFDMWEHAFILDFAPADKAKYVEALFANLNWGIVKGRY
jgi:Fe-Mn family superoxide dismutase